MTGSLVSVAANLFVSEFGTLFLDIVDSVHWRWRQGAAGYRPASLVLI